MKVDVDSFLFPDNLIDQLAYDDARGSELAIYGNTLSGDATSSSTSMKVKLFWVHCGITKNRPSIILRLSGNKTKQAHRRRTCMDLFLHSAEYEERPSRFMTKLPFHRSHRSTSQAQTHDAASTSPLLVSTNGSLVSFRRITAISISLLPKLK
jgi:hypothetical protein